MPSNAHYFAGGQQDAEVDALTLDAFSPQQTAINPDEKHSPNDQNPNTNDWPIDLRSNLATLERDLAIRALTEAQYSQRKAATLLGLSYDQMRSVVRKHKLQVRLKST